MVARLKKLLFENTGTRQTIIKNIFWSGFGQIASRFIRAGIIIYSARILGAAEYGIFSYALGLAAFFTIFADVGLIQILTREIAKNPKERTHYFITSFWLKLCLLFGTSLLIIFVAPYFSKIEAAKALIPFVALLTIFDGIRELSLAFVRALEKMEVEAFVTILTNITIATAGFVILLNYPSSKALTLTYAISSGIGAATIVIILRSQFKYIFSHFNRKLVRSIITSSLPFAFIGLLGAFMLNTDLIMLGWWRSAEEIGYYSAAQKIIAVLYTLPGILAGASFPSLSRLIGQNKHSEVRILTEKGIAIALLIGLPIAVGGVVIGKSLIFFVYGEAYMSAVLVFQILVSSAIFFPSAFVANLILAYDKQKKAMWFVALGSIANVVLDAFFIPRFGGPGSAVTTLIAQVLTTVPMWMIAKNINYFEITPYIRKIAVATILMGACSLVFDKIHLNVLANIGFSSAIYFVLLYLLKEELLKEMTAIFGALKPRSIST